MSRSTAATSAGPRSTTRASGSPAPRRVARQGPDDLRAAVVRPVGRSPLIRTAIRGDEQEGMPARATLMVSVAEVVRLAFTLTPRTQHVRVLMGRKSPFCPVRRPELDLTALLQAAAHDPPKRPVIDDAALDAVEVVSETGDLVRRQESSHAPSPPPDRRRRSHRACGVEPGGRFSAPCRHRCAGCRRFPVRRACDDPGSIAGANPTVAHGDPTDCPSPLTTPPHQGALHGRR